MADPTYDGLCGVPSHFALRDGKHLRCKYELGHAGDHEWKKYEEQFAIRGGWITREEALRRAKRGSAFAQAILRIPPGCVCTPLYSQEGDVVDYLFSPECKAHAAVTRP
jgi:hypothetical protein